MIRRRNIFCYLMVAPALILVLMLGIYPMLDTLRLSFLQYDLMRVRTEGTPFVGLKNFETIFQDPDFLQTLINTIIFPIIVIAGLMLMGLMLAQVLNFDFRGRGFLRALVLVPWVTPPVVTSGVWTWIFQPERSPINLVLRALGIISTDIRFLTDSSRTWGPISIPMLALCVVRMWNALPFATVMILAGLQSIPKELYEAAEIDGATRFSKFIFVTLPMLRPVLTVLIALMLMTGFGYFGVNYIMTAGGPADLTNILAVEGYLQAFVFYRFDLAAAISSVVLILTSIVAIFYVRLRIREAQEA